MQYLIIGGSIAAASAIMAIRASTPAARITVITAETPAFYYRPMLPLLVEGVRSEEDLAFTPDFFDTSGLELVHDQAIGLDPDHKRVQLATGSARGYDRLLIATGSSAVLPAIAGLGEARQVFALRSLADAKALREACRAARRSVVIGGGLVGLKTAWALKVRGLAVTVVEQQEQLLFPRLDREAAAMVAAALQASGIEVITGQQVRQIDSHGLQLASDQDLAADLVVNAAGSLPNVEWLRSSGLQLEQGVVTDEFLRASREDIYAAGDAAQTLDLVDGSPKVCALWLNAVETGRTAGTNMAGGKRRYPGSLSVMNATELAGLAMVSVGAVTDEQASGSEVVVDQTPLAYRKLVFSGDVLIGAIFLGEISGAGLYTNLIRSQRRLGPLKAKAMRAALRAADLLADGPDAHPASR